MYETLLSLLLCTSASGVLVDRSLEAGARGRDVVDTVLYRIRRSRVFPDDDDFIRRVAYTENMFGEDPWTYRPGYAGGLWNTDRFNMSQYDRPYRSISPKLRNIHEAIKKTMGIDWMQVTEADLLKPLYSGLTAWIITELFRRQFPRPSNVVGQGEWWHDLYSARRPVYGDFQNRTLELLIEDMRPFGGKIDLMLVVDGSCRVGMEAYASSLDSLARLVGVFDLREANVGLVVYSNRVTDKIPLTNDLTMLALQESIRSTDYPNNTANIYAGIMGAINEFQTLPNARKESGAPKLMVIFTDGNHTAGPDPGLAAEKAARAGIVTCAFGIGDAIDDGQLLRIANNDADFKFKTESHYTLREQIVRVAQRAKTMPQTLKMGSDTSVTMKDGDAKRYFLLEVPEEGATITLINAKGETRGYWTFTPEPPSSALYEGVLTEGETFISPPRLGKYWRRRRTNLTMPPKNMLLTLQGIEADNRVTLWIDKGDVIGCGFAAAKFDVTSLLLSATFVITTVLLK
nr:PREDICTED: uncharacterized protein LOC109042837 [Bemisia tabaci]